MSGIHTYGETVHLFIERKNYNGVFMPGLKNGNPIIIRLQQAFCM
jgi:4-hydroxyphenylpyruvate dioxygenase